MSKQRTGAQSNALESSAQSADAGGKREHTNTQVPGKHVVLRSVKSFRMREDLSHRIEILAAEERRKIYEVVEEALEAYLAHRGR